jgi:hypothetical protein
MENGLMTLSETIAENRDDGGVSVGGVKISQSESENIQTLVNNFTADMSIDNVRDCIMRATQSLTCDGSTIVAGGSITFANVINSVGSCLFSASTVQKLASDINNELGIESSTSASNVSSGDLMGIAIVLLLFLLLGGGGYYLFVRKAVMNPTTVKYVAAGVLAVGFIAGTTVLSILTHKKRTNEIEEEKEESVWKIPYFYGALVCAFLSASMLAYILMMIFMSG